MRRLLVCLTLVCLGCPGPATPEVASKEVTAKAPAPPPITGLPVSLTVKQRSRTPIPGSGDQLTLATGDITKGSVETSLEAGDGVVLKPVAMKSTERHTFDFKGQHYELTLVELYNALIGEDFAKYRIVEKDATDVLTEQQKIDRLIAAVESLEGAKFIRNKTEHSPKEAADHLREKRKAAGDQLTTAVQFIDQIGSRSSLTGEEYEIRFSDGRSVLAGEFLKQELKKLSPEASAQPAIPPGG